MQPPSMTRVFFNPGYADVLINLAEPLIRISSVFARSDAPSRYRISALTLYSSLLNPDAFFFFFLVQKPLDQEDPHLELMLK